MRKKKARRRKARKKQTRRMNNRDQNRMAARMVTRTCCACRRKGEKDSFLRIVKKPDGTVVPDPRQKISGRGVYLCRDEKCLAKAKKSKAVERSFLGYRAQIPQDLYERIRSECL